MSRRKVIHCGKGPAVHDRSGWRLAAGDAAVSLPRPPDANVLRALAKKTLVYVDKTAAGATSSVDNDTTEQDVDDSPVADERSNRLTLVECARALIEDVVEGTLTSSGKPTVDALKELFIENGGDPEFEITATLRDEVTVEAQDIVNGK